MSRARARLGAQLGVAAASREGFGLIEVLLGVLVVSVALAGLYALYSALLKAEAHRREQVEAAEALLSVVEQIKALPWATLWAGFPNGQCPSGATSPSGVSLRCSSQRKGPRVIEVTVTAWDRQGRLIDQVQFRRFVQGF